MRWVKVVNKCFFLSSSAKFSSAPFFPTLKIWRNQIAFTIPHFCDGGKKMLPWKVWDWDCNLIPGLRAPSPLSAYPRPPVYSKTRVREMLSKLICTSDGDLKSSDPKMFFTFTRISFFLVSGMHMERVHTHTNNKNFCSPPIPLMLGKSNACQPTEYLHASLIPFLMSDKIIFTLCLLLIFVDICLFLLATWEIKNENNLKCTLKVV